MIVIDIFKENHRFSERTPHPGPHSVVDAVNPARRPPRRKQPRDHRTVLPQFGDLVVLTEQGD
jgi:hypothetical protein